MADWPYSDPRWPIARLQALERDGYRCQIRGPRCTETATEADHRIPVIEDPGKAFDLENLRASCKPCNAGRGQGRMAAQARLNRQVAPEPSRDW